MKNKLAHWIVSARWLIIITFGILLALAVTQLSKFKIDASADTLLVKDNALYIKSQVAAQVFSPEEFILLAYEPTGHELFSEQTFNDLQMLSTEINKIDRVKAVTSILTVPLIRDKSVLTSGTDVNALTWQAKQYSPDQMETLVAGHPIFTDLLVNKQASATAIQVVFEDNETLSKLEAEITRIQAQMLDGELSVAQEKELEQLKKQAEPIKATLSKLRQNEIHQLNDIASQVDERANTYLGGSYVVGQHLIDIIQSDLKTFGSAIAGVIALLLFILYRTIRWVIFPLAACAISVVFTMGLFGFLDLRTTVISANFVALQLILTLAVMIHLIGAYRQISRDDESLDGHKRIVATLKEKLAPCFFATLTTSVGFGALIFSGLQPVMVFGYMMLIAMIITMLVSLLLFPAVLSLLRARKETTEFAFVTRFFEVMRKLTLKHPITISLVMVGLFGALATGISRLNVENSFIDYFAQETRVYKELAFIDQQFGGSTPLDIILKTESETDNNQLVLKAGNVNQLQLVQAAVNAFEATGSVTSVVNFTQLARQLNDDRPLTEYELTTIYHLLDEKVVNQLIGSYFSAENNQLRISVRVQDTTAGLDRADFLENLKQDIQTVGVEAQNVELTGLFVLYQDILSRLFDSQIKTLGIVYVVLGLVLLAIFRSVKIALIALVPNILTTLGILGMIGWLAIPLDIMTITIAAIAMGIAVDDTIHFLHAYLTGMKNGEGRTVAEKAGRSAFGHTGLAILFTTTIIAAGFSLFGFSDFIPSVNFGLLTATAMVMALITDITLLPALLNKFVAKPKSA
ncbi:efflux RND transporter permease subunit [Alteromonas lipotrueiana]|uniref:efflux RND transporter permease subunit n=1 Tax=Alteromonas lipotrueiana TaxID=2803815 RepID=UPI001C473975|nr:MMPL family transporter [Alteromonas lipotrueiana]